MTRQEPPAEADALRGLSARGGADLPPSEGGSPTRIGEPAGPARGSAGLRRLRRLAGGDVAGERQADAAGPAGFLARLLGDGRLGLVLVGEDLLRRLAREQALELVGVERLVLDQDLRHGLQLV